METGFIGCRNFGKVFRSAFGVAHGARDVQLNGNTAGDMPLECPRKNQNDL